MSALLESLLDPERRSQAVSADEKAALLVTLPKQEVSEHELMRCRIMALREDFTALQRYYDGSIYDVIDSLSDALVHWKATYPLTTEQISDQYHDARDERRGE